MKVVIDQKYFCLFESIGKRIRFYPGKFVFCESDEANEIYLIVKGRVQVYLGTSSGKQTTIEVLKEGRIFGDASFLEHSVRKANIVAITDVELICCRITDLIPILQENSELALLMMRHLTSTCNYLTNTINRLVNYDSIQKVADFLLTETNPNEPVIPYTHSDVAGCLNLNRVTVSRIMGKFKAEGAVEYGRGKIRVLKRQKLEELLK